MYRTCAPAKVNLDLRILAPRADGYHELATVLQSLALSDVLTLRPVEGPFGLHCVTPGVPTDSSNLAWRGAEAVAAATGRSLGGWRLELEKHVPAQAGLGGGSADAVAAARLLLAAWAVAWDTAWLGEVLAPIGADVAYFVRGGTVRARGRGERLEQLADEPFRTVVLARPPFGVSTREAYGWFDADMQARSVSSPARAADPASRRNDLEPPVVARHPELAEAIATLDAAGAELAMLSGSGSAVFALFSSEADATRAADRAAGVWPDDWMVTVTSTLSRHAYEQATRVDRVDDPAFSLSGTPAVV